MLGLDGYQSSDEDGDHNFMKENKATSKREVLSHALLEETDHNISPTSPGHAVVEVQPEQSIGPSLAPRNDFPLVHNGTGASQQQMHELTLPPVPNLIIPTSPGGQAPELTTTKFAHFLEIKKQGIHFNHRITKSSALRNPSLLQKLLHFANIDEDGQYANTLPEDLKVTPADGFPKWCYFEELNKRQEETRRKRDDERTKGLRDIDFVSGSASSSRGTTPGGSARAPIKGSTAERVILSLDRERSGSPSIQDSRKRKDHESKRSRFDDRYGGP